MNIKRGDIFLVKENQGAVGSEFKKTRPAIVVSNDMANRHSPVVEVVYLSTLRPNHNWLPTHVIVKTDRTCVAKCEGIYSVSTDRLVEHFGNLSDYDMEKINIALKISLGL